MGSGNVQFTSLFLYGLEAVLVKNAGEKKIYRFGPFTAKYPRKMRRRAARDV